MNPVLPSELSTTAVVSVAQLDESMVVVRLGSQFICAGGWGQRLRRWCTLINAILTVGQGKQGVC